MSIGGTIRTSDYIAAQFLHMRRTAVFFAGFVFVAVLLCFLLLKNPFSPQGAGFYLLCYFAALTAAFVLYIPIRAKRTLRQYKALSEPITIEVQELGLRFKRLNGEMLLPWSHLQKWRYNRRVLLLYVEDRLFHMVPSHFFSSANDFAAFVNVLNRRG